eukprot:m.218261 g.218261  ORF g.218261 m.218261 type:complete len:309 (+) comp15903_c0_seq1:309-1235(+)
MGGGASKELKRLQKENAQLKAQLAELGGGIRTVSFLHFNDCYNLEPLDETKYPCGGASRFMDGIRKAREEMNNPVTVFSGDMVGPSLMSTVTKGAHIKEALDTVGVDFGCLGNHEWDYGSENLHRLLHGYTRADGTVIPGSRVQWLMTNLQGENGAPIAGCSEYALISRGGVKIGFLGLVDDWVHKLPIPKGSYKYLDILKTGESVAQKLKKEENCDIVVALTHSKLECDLETTKKCPSIDLLLGGHDHFFKSMPKERVIKSGQDWEYIMMTVTLTCEYVILCTFKVSVSHHCEDYAGWNKGDREQCR